MRAFDNKGQLKVTPGALAQLPASLDPASRLVVDMPRQAEQLAVIGRELRAIRFILQQGFQSRLTEQEIDQLIQG